MDSEIQLHLLSDKNHNMLLEQILRVAEAKEAGERSATHVLLPHVTDTVTSSANKHQIMDAMKSPSQKDQDPCSYCGKKGIAKNP